MKIPPLHPWPSTPQEAIALQRRLREAVVAELRLSPVRYVAGADIATYKDSSKGYAGVVVMSYPELKVVERQAAECELSFPYIPGLLAFREAPVLLAAFERVQQAPDLILIDGQGLAHPRRFGIACHLGLLLETPTIGCAKSRLFGRHDEPAPSRGSVANLSDDGGAIIGAVVRTKDRVQPIYVSIGHHIDLAAAIHYTLACGRGYRVPEPTRQAHLFVGGLRQSGVIKATREPLSDQLTLLE